MRRRWIQFGWLGILCALGWCGCGRREYALTDARLKIVAIDSDRHESYLALAFDGTGRMFVGGREALFVYEPAAGGLYRSRQELYRFGPDTWIYNVAVRGHDLYVLTASALYVVPDGVVKRRDLQPRKILWGFPTLHVHQSMHGLTFGPDGDLYISIGDPVWYQANFGKPDHWTYWTFHHGAEDLRTPYVGTGGVLRLSPDGRELSSFATGTRNDCGLAFDAQWNLFGPDNDHEQDLDAYSPGRLLYIPEGSYFNWPRGWMTEKQPWRADLLQTMSARLGRYVPVGLCYYNDDFLPKDLRDCLYVARWDDHSIPRYPLEKVGDAFRTEELPFLGGTADGTARPVNVAVGRGGRLFGVVSYMGHNDSSPHYRSDLSMITRRDDPKSAPFQAMDETEASLDQLFSELETPSWDRRWRAHVELTRRGAPALTEATRRLAAGKYTTTSAAHLLWLAAASQSEEARAKLINLTTQGEAATRLNAVRALARFGTGDHAGVFAAALADADPRVRRAALIGFLDQKEAPPWDRIEKLAASTLDRIAADGVETNGPAMDYATMPAWQTAGQAPHWEEGSYTRQAAAFLLAQRAPLRELSALCEDSDPRRRILGVMAVGFCLTYPATEHPPDKWIPMSSVLIEGTNYFGGDEMAGRAEDARWCADAGTFSTMGIWLAVTMTAEQKNWVALLEHRLVDNNKNVAREALLFLRMARNRRSDQALALELGLARQLRDRRALPNSRAATATNLPPAFRGVDWTAESAKGDARRGHDLFVNRGCNRCHSISMGDGGSGGPSLAGAGSRFNVPYLAESVMAPNAVVSPLFRWTALRLKDGTELDGLVVNETPDELAILMPSTERRTVAKEEIVSRQVQDHSPMPEGLINTPGDLRDLLAFLRGLR